LRWRKNFIATQVRKTSQHIWVITIAIQHRQPSENELMDTPSGVSR